MDYSNPNNSHAPCALCVITTDKVYVTADFNLRRRHSGVLFGDQFCGHQSALCSIPPHAGVDYARRIMATPGHTASRSSHALRCCLVRWPAAAVCGRRDPVAVNAILLGALMVYCLVDGRYPRWLHGRWVAGGWCAMPSVKSPFTYRRHALSVGPGVLMLLG